MATSTSTTSSPSHGHHGVPDMWATADFDIDSDFLPPESKKSNKKPKKSQAKNRKFIEIEPESESESSSPSSSLNKRIKMDLPDMLLFPSSSSSSETPLPSKSIDLNKKKKKKIKVVVKVESGGALPSISPMPAASSGSGRKVYTSKRRIKTIKDSLPAIPSGLLSTLSNTVLDSNLEEDAKSFAAMFSSSPSPMSVPVPSVDVKHNDSMASVAGYAAAALERLGQIEMGNSSKPEPSDAFSQLFSADNRNVDDDDDDDEEANIGMMMMGGGGAGDEEAAMYMPELFVTSSLNNHAHGGKMKNVRLREFPSSNTHPFGCTRGGGCTRRYRTEQARKNHESKHDVDPLSCPYAGCIDKKTGVAPTFTVKNSLQYHIDSTHKKLRNFFCECFRGFASKSQLKRHKRTHTKERPYACNECDRSFSQNGQRTNHKEKKHNVDGKPWLCDVDGCGTRFEKKRPFLEHRSSAHPDVPNFI